MKMLTRRDFIKAAVAASSLGLVAPLTLLSSENSSFNAQFFKGSGQLPLGNWQAEVHCSSGTWGPGMPLDIHLQLQMESALLSGIMAAVPEIKALLLLVTAERCFDPDGWLRMPWDDRMSTLLTPSGLAIEGGVPGASSKYLDGIYRTPVDELVMLPLKEVRDNGVFKIANFHINSVLPHDLPPGIYRLRFDFGILSDKQRLSLNIDDAFGALAFGLKHSSLLYSPPIPCNGTDINGKAVNAAKIVPRIYWVLLEGYNSNGYRGVIADEDAKNFALSDRNLIHDEIILPLFSDEGQKIAYNIEPTPMVSSRNIPRAIPLNYSSGELSVTITDPSGHTTDLGTATFKGKRGTEPTSGDPRLTSWIPSAYGRYIVTAKGWMSDIWGNRYQGGGTYRFWIAKRMTMATATFQGMAYPVGTSYGRDISFFPSVPADASVDVALYPYSDRSRTRQLRYGGRASESGIFGPAQGVKPFVLDSPGEYHAKILATYTDKHGHLWVSSMRHAGIVYPEDSSIIAHGKKIMVDNQLRERGETYTEGFYDPNIEFRNQRKNFSFVDFPYNHGDVMLIASEGLKANDIMHILTYEFKGDQPYNPRLKAAYRVAAKSRTDSLNNVPMFEDKHITNVCIRTSNGMSPHMYPEYITDWEYFYAAAPRPGFPSRFSVRENGTGGVYWPTSSSGFGGQIGASNNGDLPGDIYRLIGGVVVRRSGRQPCYAGYMASAFILPGGSKNNRIIAPGSEELIGADGSKSRFFLASARPGTVYEQNAVFVPFVQVDPILPVHIRYVLRYPDGSEKITEGVCDKFGHFIGHERWPLEQAGVYVFKISADWNGHKGYVPGLPEEGGFLFVRESTAPNQSGLKLALAEQQTFDVTAGLKIDGSSSADEVCFTAIMPGAIIDQGRIPVKNGSFTYHLDPAEVNRRIPIYDIENRGTRHKEIGRIIHLTFFSFEKPTDIKPFHSFNRVVIRGTTALYTL
ncbi:MAG: hypothetical protein HQM09_15735 [Candidatus Riflebacteria bacterium]|nr:hypothetical protein [Candidatus Riflebacteria bacterium]